MITNSRITQPIGSKLEQDPVRNYLSGIGAQEKSMLPSDSLLSGGNLLNNGVSAGKGNTFDQLLQLANLESDKSAKTSQKRELSTKDKKNSSNERKSDSRDRSGEKKVSQDSTSARVKNKKDEEKLNETGSAELAQFLTAQQLSAMQDKKGSQTKSTAQESNLQQNKISAHDALNAGTKKQALTEEPTHLNDALKNLNNENPGQDAQASAIQNEKNNDLRELASKFDSVQMDFSSSSQNTGEQSQLSQTQLEKTQMNKENLLKLMQQDKIESELAFRDFIKQSVAQSTLAESQASDRLANLNQLKDAHLDRLNLSEIKQDALLAQQQVRELQAGQPSQWKSIDELTPDQLAMLDSMSGTNNASAAEKIQGFSQNIPTSVQQRILGSENDQSKNLNQTQNTLDPNALFSSINSEGNGKKSFNQNSSSFSGNSNRGEMSPIGQNTTAKVEDTDLSGQEKAQQAKADARTRESERTREMARNATQRAQTIAAELAAKGGGTARIQIKDSQLGVVELRINMSDDNRMNVQLVANSDRIKQELEKHADALKDGLEKHQLIVDGVNFSTDMKLGESSFQSGSQNDNQSQQQSFSQNQQSFGSFQQNNSGQGQGNFNQERFFEAQQINVLSNQLPQNQTRQTYAGKNETQTNIQRSANGSLKVTA